MVHTIAASKNKTHERKKAIMAWAAVSSLDSISLESDCGFVREKLTKPGYYFLRVAVNGLRRCQDALEERLFLVRDDHADLVIYHNFVLWFGENYLDLSTAALERWPNYDKSGIALIAIICNSLPSGNEEGPQRGDPTKALPCPLSTFMGRSPALPIILDCGKIKHFP